MDATEKEIYADFQKTANLMSKTVSRLDGTFNEIKTKKDDGFEMTGINIGFNDDETFSISVQMEKKSERDNGNGGTYMGTDYDNYTATAKDLEDLKSKLDGLLAKEAAEEGTEPVTQV